MSKYIFGPLFPERSYKETDLEFVQVSLHRPETNTTFGKVTLPDEVMRGAICGVQAITVPNKKKGVSYSEQLLGTAFFIAPGVAVSAWHVLEGFLPEPVNGKWDKVPIGAEFQVVSLLAQGEALVWPVTSFAFGNDGVKGSDLTAMGCHLSGEQPGHKVHHYLKISTRFPAIGERLYMFGLKEPSARSWPNRQMIIDTFVSAGTVIDVHPNGRGRMPVGPCFTLDSGATGGMSGAPVFDYNGSVVGVLSTGSDDAHNGYSVISSTVSLLEQNITQSWREDGKKNVPVRELLGL